MRNMTEYTQEYVKEGFEFFQVEYRRRKVLSILERINPRRIIEIGCGMHPIFEFWDNYAEYVFFEPSKEMFNNANLLKGNNGRIKGYNELFQWKEELSSFSADFILCSSLLHEVDSPGELLDCIRKYSSKETITHINVPNACSFHRVLAKAMNLIENVKDKSERNILLQQNIVFDMNSLEKMVSDHGFEVFERGSYFIKPFSHDQMWSMIKSGIIDKRVLDGLYEMGETMGALGSEIYVNCVIK